MGEPRDLGKVVVTIPAHADHVHILRTLTASVAARLPMSLDDVDDLRLAVDEAAGRLLQFPGAMTLRLELHAGAEGLEVAIGSDAEASAWPGPNARSTLPWKILTALAERVRFERIGTRARIRFFKRAELREVRA